MTDFSNVLQIVHFSQGIALSSITIFVKSLFFIYGRFSASFSVSFITLRTFEIWFKFNLTKLVFIFIEFNSVGLSRNGPQAFFEIW